MADICDSIVMSLAKKGYWGGSPTNIWSAPTDQVIEAYNYEVFIADYTETELLINGENNG